MEDENNFIVKLEKQPSNIENGELKEYQMEGLNWLVRLYHLNINGILADEMGLGKTIQTISLIGYLEMIRNKAVKRSSYYIVLVPKVTLSNWRRELEKWLPSLKVLVFYGNKEERVELCNKLKEEDFDLVLTTYECAMIERVALQRLTFDYFVIDEAHRIKNEKSKFSTIIRQFTSKRRLLITGTPLQNNLHELWALLNFLMPSVEP